MCWRFAAVCCDGQDLPNDAENGGSRDCEEPGDTAAGGGSNDCSDRAGNGVGNEYFHGYNSTLIPMFPIVLPHFLPHFRLYEVVSLLMCVLPYKHRERLEILEFLLKLMKLCECFDAYVARMSCSPLLLFKSA